MLFVSWLMKIMGQKRNHESCKELKSDVTEDESETFEEKKSKTYACPYLDTISRHVLDFDFEKLCCISLSRNNVYACLICGKYYQGRGPSTHAYIHSVSERHHVFLNLHTLKFYCLPDNYEIIDSSLEDIKYLLKPTFTQKYIEQLETNDRLTRAYDGTMYLPGIVGLNNIKANDYCNVVLQALSHVPTLRNYFLREENYMHIQRPPGDMEFLLVQRFGELLRKLWNPRNFKAHVSPHEMLQAVVLCSKKTFQFTKQGDAVHFLSWFLNSLHQALGGTKAKDSSIIVRTFQGSMRITTRKIPPVEFDEREKDRLRALPEYQATVQDSTFLYLTADLPPPPLFKDELKENIIPQVSLYALLTKFNGITEKEYKTYKENFIKKFEITHLPSYLILYIKLDSRSIDFGDLLSAEIRSKHKHTVYDLLANIVHDGDPQDGSGTYRCHILHKGTGKWFEMQDLHVKEILPQMITLTEAYIQIYEQRRD